MLENELLPCPFCGGEAEYERQGGWRQSEIVVCTDCGCRLEYNGSPELESNWNMREQNAE